MKRLTVLALAGVLAFPSAVAAQSPAPPATPYREFLENDLGLLEELQGILATDGPDQAAALAAPVADHFEQVLMGTHPDPCYAGLYINTWHVATLVRLLSEVSEDQRQGLVDLIADRLSVGSDLLDNTECAVVGALPGPSTAPVVAPTATPEPTPKATRKPKPTPRPSYKRLSKRDWQKLVRSPDRHIGERIQVWACISQFDAATGEESFRGQAMHTRTEFWWSYGENAFFEGPASRLDDFVADDIVWMNVEVLGSYSYDTQIGGSTTVPLFAVKSIKRKGSCE